MFRRCILICLGLACAACHAEPRREQRVLSEPEPEPDIEPQAGSAPSATPECRSEADCHAVDDTCGSCRCLALARTAEAPRCTAQTVQCFVQPCRGKRASCRDQRCVVTDALEAEQ